jgi:hypothetical protein
MSAEATFWKVVELLAALLIGAAPVYVAYDIYNPSSNNPEKHLDMISGPEIDPLADLAALRRRAAISVTVGDETFNNLVIWDTLFMNVGDVPILPSDYYKNLKVTVNKPWKIVAVDNQVRYFKGIPISWKRIDERTFEAEPALLNPHDRLTARVYLTNTQFVGGHAKEDMEKPNVEWSARITNLHGFTKPTSRLDDPKLNMWGMVVSMHGWAVPFSGVSAILFQALYLHLLAKLYYLREWGWQSLGMILITGVVSVAGAESIATYLFGNQLTFIIGVKNWYNAPPIIIHALLLAFLWWKVHYPERTPLEAG